MKRYAESHEWIDLDDQGIGTVGISDHAADALAREIVYIELPAVGAELEQGGTLGVIEAVKAASDIYAPVAGTVIEVNETAAADPSLVGHDPEGAGWLVKLQVTGTLDHLMNLDDYQSTVH